METTETLEAPVETASPLSEDIQAVYNFVADQLVRQQRAAEDVIEMLVQKGMNSADASTIVESMQQQIAEAKKNRAQKDMLWGGVWFFGGLIVTFGTYSAASNGGGYIITWGAIIFGGIQFFRGLINSQS